MKIQKIIAVIVINIIIQYMEDVVRKKRLFLIFLILLFLKIQKFGELFIGLISVVVIEQIKK